MLIQNLALYDDKYYIRVNEENDLLFYFFDYDVRSADINMQFQHFHTFYEMCILLCPNAVHFIEGKPHELQAFDIVAIPPNVLHKSQYPVGTPCKRLIIQFNLPRSVPGLSNEYEQLLSIFHSSVPIFRFDSDLKSKLFRKLNEIFLLAPKTDSMRNLIIHQKFVEFLTLLFLNHRSNKYSDETELSSMEKKIYSITSFIHSHFSEELTLESLSEQFCISSSYLSHQFKNVTGFTVTDYIQMTRIRNVQALLINTKIPITEVCGPCGFNSFSQFNRVFRKHIGMSPSSYRKQHQMDHSEFI